MFSCQRLSSRARILLAIGNTCLFTGVALSLLATGLGRHHHAIFNAARFGFLMLAIGLNLQVLRLKQEDARESRRH